VTATVHAESVGVRFLFDRQARVVTPTLARLRRRGSETWGLRNLTFSLRPGDTVALLGPSGSGKTTLLRTIASVFRPDAGTMQVRGRVASLLSIEAGLLPPLTGRENCLLLGVLAGLSRRDSRARLEDIKAESGLGDSFERPIASYSQGMRARLGYTVAAHTNPDILLLDEVHEALDHEFREIVYEQAQRIAAGGGIVVAAGHDHGLLDHLCERGLLLDRGHLRADGAFAEVQQIYVGESPDS
jgi:ABC-type polysaccharide/polyol phosphate transport system ATPase subunit